MDAGRDTLVRIRATLEVKGVSNHWAKTAIRNRASDYGFVLVSTELKKWNRASGIYLVTYGIGADNREMAYSVMAGKLNDWFAEDLDKEPPYPSGALLWWGTRKTTMFPKEDQ
jgi:hypothetical protein